MISRRAFPASSAFSPLSIAGLLFAAAVALPASAPAFVGQWHQYSDKSRITALIEHQGFVYAGTQSGVRRVKTGTLDQRDYGNLDGLIDPWIMGFAADSTTSPPTLWASSLSGYLYALQRGGTRWEVHGRSYAADGWMMNARAILAADSSLFLGSTKGLAVFDTRLKVSQLNLTRFGNDLDVQVLSLLRRADTLYVGTSAGVYKARVFFADPLNPAAGYANIADHNQWIKAVLPVQSGRQYNHLAFIGDSLATYGPGTLLQASGAGVRVEAFAGSPLVIGSQTYAGAWNDFTSAVRAGGKVFAGGNTGLAVSAAPAGDSADAAILDPLFAHPRDTIASLGAYGGVVWGQSRSGVHRFAADTGVFRTSAAFSMNSVEVIDRNLRNTKVDGNGDVYFGTWGLGVVRVRNGVATVWNKSSPGGNCILEIIPNYPVVHALGRPRGNLVYFAMFYSNSNTELQLVSLNTSTGDITCLDSTITGTYAHAVEAIADTLVAVASDRGVAFQVVREGFSGPSVESSTLWTLAGSANEAWDLARDQWGRPWALIGDQLAFADSLATSTARKLKPLEQFSGTGCKNLEADTAGWLWVGCENGLYHLQTGQAGELASSRRYGVDDGLPSLVIYDVSVDRATGKVWVATDHGVAMLESEAQPAIASEALPAIVPYPNPFRPQHAYVVFNKLPANSTLRIHDPSGHVVRTFRPGDLRGNEAQWDGKNEDGKKVAPGVYLFSVVSGSKVQRGKVIVAR